MDCERAWEVVFLIGDKQLEPDLTRAFEDHLDSCSRCARKAVATRRVLAMLRERCIRQQAPTRLRLRILTSFEHRRGAPNA